MPSYPDFIIIGAMKSATSTLHEQLAAQPGIFMSRPKEPNFFSDDEQYARGLEWYKSLFAAAPPGALTGESSTHYTKLPTYPKTVERMRKALGDVKLIYVMRHPVDRLVSHYIHEWTERRISVPIDEAVKRHPELVAYSQYARQLEPYFETFGKYNVLPVFFQRLRQFPQSELERVCRFIGYDRTPEWSETIQEQNASVRRLRKSPIRDAVVEFAPLKFIRRNFVPQSVRDRVKRLWIMEQRPELSPSVRRQLETELDRDLETLGAWLQMDLSCDSFDDPTRAQVPGWV